MEPVDGLRFVPPPPHQVEVTVLQSNPNQPQGQRKSLLLAFEGAILTCTGRDWLACLPSIQRRLGAGWRLYGMLAKALS